jgi:hypothetical protein
MLTLLNSLSKKFEDLGPVEEGVLAGSDSPTLPGGVAVTFGGPCREMHFTKTI